MKGLVSNPRGEMIPRPIKSSFREGSRSSSTSSRPRHPQGPRRHRASHRGLGLPDPSTRRRGPGTHRQGVRLRHAARHVDRARRARHRGQRAHLETKLGPRRWPRTSPRPSGATIAAGTMLMVDDVERFARTRPVSRVRVRTTLTCDAVQGVCAACYGLSLATHQSSSSAKRSASSPPSPSASRAPSSPCVRSTPVV